MSETIGELRRATESRLSSRYGRGEAQAMVRLIFHALKGWNTTDLIINSDRQASDYLVESIGKIVTRLQNDEPLQYILGEARFYGMDLKVSPSVLIPRPETEELVDIIVKQLGNRDDLSVLDVGTGSGAIAIALSRNLPFSKVTAVDVSENALEIARQNAANLKASISFIHADIFDFMPDNGVYDLIVSNPPYIAEHERAQMDKNVLDYEPHIALFVADSDPLIFYRRIAMIGLNALKPGGSLYFEINPLYSVQLEGMLREMGYVEIDLEKDISGRVRFACAKRALK